MKKINILFLLLAFAAAASGGDVCVAGYYRLNTSPDYDYFDGFGGVSHGGGAKLAWHFREPFAAEFAVAASAESDRDGIWIPEYFPPDERIQIPTTAALTVGTRIWRLYTYAVAGVGVMYEINKAGVSWRELDYPNTVHVLALWGAGVRVRVTDKVYAEFSPRYVTIAGDQLAFWDMNDGFHYRDGHPDVVEITAGIGVYL